MWLNTEFPSDLHALAAHRQTLIVNLPLLFSSPGKLKASKAASTVLSNMFQYKKLHKDYKQVSDLNFFTFILPGRLVENKFSFTTAT